MFSVFALLFQNASFLISPNLVHDLLSAFYSFRRHKRFFLLRVLDAVQAKKLLISRIENVYEPVNFRNSITTSLIFHLLLLDKVPFQDLRIANSVALNFVIGINKDILGLYLGIEDELVEMLDLVLLLEPLSLSIFKQMLVDSFGFKVDLIQRLKIQINIWAS